MIEGKDIICIANTTWHGEYTKSTVQIMSRLANKNRVVFVQYPFTWKDILTTLVGRQKAPIKSILGLNKRLTLLGQHKNGSLYHLVVPPMVPVDFISNNKIFNLFFNLNIAIYKRQLLHTMNELGIKSPIVVTAYNPFFGLALTGRLHEELNVYYCYDGIGTRRHGRRIYKIDEAFSKKADAIITTSDYLNAEKKRFNPNSFVVRNGVDYQLFKAHAKTRVTGNRRKVIGYIGSLDHRFDIDTVEFAVNELKDFDFHLTGSLKNPVIKQRLDKYPNASFFSPVKPEEVPALLSTYDAGIIPYIANEINKNIYPLKINEYMAVGVPVVMTSFADLFDFKKMVRTARDAQEFVQKIKEEIKNDNPALIQKRIAFAQSNSWDHKTEEFGSILSQLL